MQLPARLQQGESPQVLVRRLGKVVRHDQPELRFHQYEIDDVKVLYHIIGGDRKRGRPPLAADASRTLWWRIGDGEHHRWDAGPVRAPPRSAPWLGPPSEVTKAEQCRPCALRCLGNTYACGAWRVGPRLGLCLMCGGREKHQASDAAYSHNCEPRQSCYITLRLRAPPKREVRGVKGESPYPKRGERGVTVPKEG